MKRAPSSDLDDGSDYEVPKPSPVKKRRKTTVPPKKIVKGKGRKNASKGGPLQHLPAELILEITSYLPPEPLVLLMFLCRFFYDILSDSSPASLKMWKHARSNETISVPPPPSDVSELQWARFLYEKHCQYCGPGTRRKLTRFFTLRKRVCAKCIAANLVSARPHIILKKIPFASEAVLPLVMLSDKDSHGNSLVTVYPSTYDNDGVEAMEIHSNYHWIPHIPAMMRELSEDFQEVFFGTSISPRGTVSDQYDAFVEDREKYIEDQLKHAHKCILWENNMDWEYEDY